MSSTSATWMSRNFVKNVRNAGTLVFVLVLLSFGLLVTLPQQARAVSVELALETLQQTNNLEYANLLRNNVPTGSFELDDTNLSLQIELNDRLGTPVAVRINSLNGSSFNWQRQDSVSITSTLPLPLELARHRVLGVLSIEGMNEFIVPKTFDAHVAFFLPREDTSAAGTYDVLWCSESHCDSLLPCIGDEETCFTQVNDIVHAYIPHFSTLVVLEDSNLSIVAPFSNQQFFTGENIDAVVQSLTEENITFTLNSVFETVPTINNGSNYVSSIDLTQLSSLGVPVLENGNHILTVSNGFENTTHHFEVNDNFAPVVQEVSGLNGSTLISQNQTVVLRLRSDELAFVNVSVNGNFVSSVTMNSSADVFVPVSALFGTNVVTIRARDIHNNTIVSALSFDLDPQGTCSDAVQNGFETGIDCGGNCGSCVDFFIGTDKSSYSNSETPILSVEARSNATVTIQVKRGSTTIHTETILPYSPGFPIFYSTIIPNTAISGTYVVTATLNYLGIQEVEQISFVVVASNNPLNAIISVPDTTINEGDSLTFTAQVTGAPGAVTYRWDLNGDGSIESTSSTFTHQFGTNGTIPVNLTVFSGDYNVSRQAVIRVYRRFNLTIFVKNETGGYVPNALVRLDSFDSTTDGNGRAGFFVRKGTYDLTISKTGYKTFSNSTHLNKNVSYTFTINSSVEDFSSPTISLVSPADNAVTTEDTLRARFIVNDQSAVTCALETSATGNSYTTGAFVNYPRGSEQEISVSLSEGLLYWRIVCKDNFAQSTTSPARSLERNSSSLTQLAVQDLDEEVSSEVEDILSQIDEMLSIINTLDPKNRAFADAISLESILKEAQKEATRFNRDLHNVRFRKGTEEEKEAYRLALLAKLDNFTDTIFADFSVKTSSEHVSFPEDTTIEDVALSYLDAQGYKLSNEEMDSLRVYLTNYQQDLVVTTQTFVVDVTMLSGNKKTITAIVKDVDLSREQLKNETLLEYIPKSLVQSIKNLDIKNLFIVIQDDPLFEVTKLIDGKIVYFAEGTLGDTTDIATVIFPREIHDLRLPKVVGFSIFAIGDFINADSAKLILQILVILALIPIALYYVVQPDLKKLGISPELFVQKLNFGKISKKKGDPMHTTQGLHSPTYQEILNTIEESNGLLQAGNVSLVKENYSHLSNLYRVLPSHEKRKAAVLLTSMKAHIDSAFLKRQLLKAEIHLEEGKKHHAKTIYKKVCELYKFLPPQHKKEVHMSCTELYYKLHR